MRSDFNYFHTLRVRYAEIDGQGIVFNSHYLTYADVAVTEYFRFIGLDYLELVKENKMDIALVKAALDFKGSALFDDVLEVGVRVSRLGKASFDVDFEIFQESREEVLVHIQSVYVNYNAATRSSAPLPDFFISAVKKVESLA